MFTVYAIMSAGSGKIYIGQTENIERRLNQRNAEGQEHLSKFTKQNKGPWKLIHSEQFASRSEALKREKQLKSYRGRQFIKNLAQNNTRP